MQFNGCEPRIFHLLCATMKGYEHEYAGAFQLRELRHVTSLTLSANQITETPVLY